MKKLLTNKIFNRIVKFIEIIFVIIIVIYLGFIVFQKISGNSSIAGYRVFTVATASMEPEYMVNDVIVVKEVDPTTLKVGDDIAYRGERGGLEGLLVTHRIIKIEKDGSSLRFYTKGINKNITNEDPSFTADRIIGKTTGVLPVITQLNHVIKNQFGFFFLVFCPIVLIIFLEIAETVLLMKIENEELVLAKDIVDTAKEEKENEEVTTSDVSSVDVVSTDTENKSNDIVNNKEESNTLGFSNDVVSDISKLYARDNVEEINNINNNLEGEVSTLGNSNEVVTNLVESSVEEKKDDIDEEELI